MESKRADERRQLRAKSLYFPPSPKPAVLSKPLPRSALKLAVTQPVSNAGQVALPPDSKQQKQTELDFGLPLTLSDDVMT